MNHLPLLFVIFILSMRYIGKHHTKSPKLPSLSSAFLYGFFLWNWQENILGILGSPVDSGES